MTNANLSTTETTTTTADDRELYFAQPYAFDGTGFYFNSLESFNTQASENRCEEFELQYIDGDDAKLFAACGVSQADLGLWFERVSELEEYEKPALFYLCDAMGYGFEEALDNLEEVSVTEGTAKDYAEQLVEDCGMLDGMPEHLQVYFDYDAFTRDMLLNGDVSEFTYNGTTYTAQQA